MARCSYLLRSLPFRLCYNANQRRVLKGGNTLDDDLRRRMVHGLINLMLSLAAAWLATYLTNKILGAPEEPKRLNA